MIGRWTLLLLLPAAVAAAGCREPPETPTATGSTYRIDWPATAGGELYERYCTACHGVAGRGDGYNARYLGVAPRNLADAGRMGTPADERLAGVVRGGGSAAALAAEMPAFGATLKDDEVGYLLAYLRLLRGGEAAQTLQSPEELAPRAVAIPGERVGVPGAGGTEGAGVR